MPQSRLVSFQVFKFRIRDSVAIRLTRPCRDLAHKPIFEALLEEEDEMRRFRNPLKSVHCLTVIHDIYFHITSNIWRDCRNETWKTVEACVNTRWNNEQKNITSLGNVPSKRFLTHVHCDTGRHEVPTCWGYLFFMHREGTLVEVVLGQVLCCYPEREEEQ